MNLGFRSKQDGVHGVGLRRLGLKDLGFQGLGLRAYIW